MLKRLEYFIFYGNYFYGLCTVGLAVEASLQQGLPLNSLYFYVALFSATVIFYTLAYIQEKKTSYVNRRSRWYAENAKMIRFTQLLWIILLATLGLYFLAIYRKNFHVITWLQLIPLVFTALIALAYYGLSIGKRKISTRNTGWFKPFVIGWVWAATVTYVPVLWHQVEFGEHYTFNQINAWYFLKNFMYISLLAILFDIKDFSADHNMKLKTFVVRYGISETINFIILPLAITGFLCFIVFAMLSQFPIWVMFINSIPFILLIIVARSMRNTKPIIYYLAVIDGLMLLKAVCGITAILLFRKITIE